VFRATCVVSLTLDTAEQRDELAPLHVRHGDFLPYALSARQPARALGFPAPINLP